MTIQRGEAYKVGREVVRVYAKARSHQRAVIGGRTYSVPVGELYRCHVLVLGVDGRELGVQRAARCLTPEQLQAGERAAQFDRRF